MSQKSFSVRVAPASDPTSLPLFRSPGPKPGRVRSGFTLSPTPAEQEPTRPQPFPPVAGVQVVERNVRVEAAGIDWGLVAALRAAASERLMRSLEANAGFGRAEQESLGRRIIHELLDWG